MLPLSVLKTGCIFNSPFPLNDRNDRNDKETKKSPMRTIARGLWGPCHSCHLCRWIIQCDSSPVKFCEFQNIWFWFVEFITSMSKSNHHDYLRQVGDRHELMRPIGYPPKKYDVLNFKRYKYSSASALEISALIKGKLNFSLILISNNS